MAYLHIRILDVREELDPTTGQTRIKAVAQEVEPRSININLSKQPAPVLNRFNELKGKVAMVPLREGMMNGQSFYKLLEEPIIEIPGANKPVSALPSMGKTGT